MKIGLWSHTRKGDVRISRLVAELEIPPGEFLDKFEITSEYGTLLKVPFQLYPMEPSYIPGAPVIQYYSDEDDDGD